MDKDKGKNLRKELPLTQHTLTVDQVYAEHGTNPEAGLRSAQVTSLRAQFGENKLTPQATIPLWLLYIYQYTNFFSLPLIGGGILCFIAYGLDKSDQSNLYLGIVLIAVVVITSSYSFYHEAASLSIMQGFKNMVPKKCKVLRDGATAVLDAVDLVPGDLVEFQEGDQVPADLRVVFAYNLKVDNSALTGESEAQERTVDLVVLGHGGDVEEGEVEHKGPQRKIPAIEASNLMFFGTIVASGHGKGVVVGTGDNTAMGQIAGLTTSGSEDLETKPPLMREVDRFIFIITVVAIILGVAFLGVGLGLEVQTVVQALVYCISVIVATVPEGLLATLTVALALTAKRMHRKNVLVKNLNCVETMGCTTVIASDKTGTLTQNRMTVQHCWYDKALHDVPAPRNFIQFQDEMVNKSDVKGPQGWSRYDPRNPTFKRLQMVATLCNNSEFQLAKEDKDKEEHGDDKGHGLFHRVSHEVHRASMELQRRLSHTQGQGQEGAGHVGVAVHNEALLDLAKECARPDFDLLSLPCTGDASESGLIKCVQLLRDVREYRSAYPKLFEIKFNSTNKWQLSIHDPSKEEPGRGPLLVMKGAPERVIKLCSKIMINGEEVAFTPAMMEEYHRAYEDLGRLGERVLGFAYRELQGMPLDYGFEEKPSLNFPNDNLTFVGLFSLMDPPRDGVPEAVEKCKRASVKVFMVTGDHPITAEAIARQVGILDDDILAQGRGKVVTGDDIRVLTEVENDDDRNAAWDKVLNHDQIVFARVTPAHKLLIVENNQRRHEVVAVTGDGVNDAPALKRANIGVSMGIAGKDVSKEAADMILMDDNFASIVNGVEEGRLIFDNLKKSICYTLTSKPPELIPFLLWVAAGFPLAISTILILAIDLGTDMVPAISLAYETREADIMHRPPRSTKHNPLVDVRLLLFTYLHFGILQVLAGYFAFLVTLNDYGFPSFNLWNRGLGWRSTPMICTIKDGAHVDFCGFGCGSYTMSDATKSVLTTAYPEKFPNGFSDNGNVCNAGCKIPGQNDAWDPFVEFTPNGFRGFGAGVEAVCGRTCAWWREVTSNGMANTYLAAANQTDNPLRLILTPEDNAAFASYCNMTASDSFGFPGRAAGDSRVNADVGGTYWWAAQIQNMPNTDYQNKVLHHAQTAYFVAVVFCKAFTALACKTRRLSLFQQGVRNNTFLLYAIVFETCIAICIVYIPPLNTVFSTRPLWGGHWFMGVPWALLLLGYDELRKWALRKWPGGLLDRLTFW